MRIGHGFDAHRFADGTKRELRLAGVLIPGSPGLAGHSDADVVAHAVTDAILGAAAQGDLGSVYGTEDPAYAGADSALFMRGALALASQAGWRVGNVDCTIVAQRPRLAPYVAAMREHLAMLLDAEPGAVSVKATSTDSLGFTGRGEGIACMAVVLLVPA